MDYPFSPQTRFTVTICRTRHSVARSDGSVFSGPPCDDCAGGFYDVEHWSSSWCVICQDCGRRYVAARERRA